MRNLFSARASARTSVVEPMTLPKREVTIPMEAETEVGMPTTSVAATNTSTSSPLGQPDAQAFSTPGTLVENDGSDVLNVSAQPVDATTPTPAPLETVAIIQRPPSNGVIYVGTPYDCATTVITPQTPSSTASMPPAPPRRSQSAISNRSAAPSITSAYDICRICHCEGSADMPLISPCCCSGSLKYVHQKCLQQWIKSSQTRSCEVCRFTFIMETKVKPFRKWEKLDISSVERRKILCSVAFHVVAITCVMWSLYVLIDRTAEEIRQGNLDWPFWTKLVVVAIGFTGGLVFMYVQCKMYVQLFRRWQSYNKVIFVQNGPAGGGPANGPAGNNGKYATNTNGDGNGSALNK